ncbi:MAG: 3-phosphoshikimate 1-carboxyvinyltransferase [Verrucomicrobiales bacterium]|nr:3-phosphoshikimate 1-carboxyvinyltransferase [Verrucomicrobiales bacterium]
MALPYLIEILPLTASVCAAVSVPGSKSITNRALILAALARGITTLKGALWSEDTQVMVECLRKLGFEITIEQDAAEASNRSIKITGCGGQVPRGGTSGEPLDLFVGNAGTAARFLAAFVCLGNGIYRLDGVPRMRERPQRALFEALRQLGYRVDSPNDKLPALIHGEGPKPGSCQVSIDESSQFASALALSARIGGWQIALTGNNSEESPYFEMTRELAATFPKEGGRFEIEPDASSGSYFWAARWLLERRFGKADVSVREWPLSKWQVDARFPGYLPLKSNISRESDLGDSIMTAIVLAPFADAPVDFNELGRLRVQETERVHALKNELNKCSEPGICAIEIGETLRVTPAALHGAEIETYHDHRMAMCFATLGLVTQGIRIRNPACVKKTFPDFFQKLATPAPHGLGAKIIDSNSGASLNIADLFAQ